MCTIKANFTVKVREEELMNLFNSTEFEKIQWLESWGFKVGIASENVGFMSYFKKCGHHKMCQNI